MGTEASAQGITVTSFSCDPLYPRIERAVAVMLAHAYGHIGGCHRIDNTRNARIV